MSSGTYLVLKLVLHVLTLLEAVYGWNFNKKFHRVHPVSIHEYVFLHIYHLSQEDDSMHATENERSGEQPIPSTRDLFLCADITRTLERAAKINDIQKLNTFAHSLSALMQTPSIVLFIVGCLTYYFENVNKVTKMKHPRGKMYESSLFRQESTLS